jgi:hypothetical protein
MQSSDIPRDEKNVQTGVPGKKYPDPFHPTEKSWQIYPSGPKYEKDHKKPYLKRKPVSSSSEGIGFAAVAWRSPWR